MICAGRPASMAQPVADLLVAQQVEPSPDQRHELLRSRSGLFSQGQCPGYRLSQHDRRDPMPFGEEVVNLTQLRRIGCPRPVFTQGCAQRARIPKRASLLAKLASNPIQATPRSTRQPGPSFVQFAPFSVLRPPPSVLRPPSSALRPPPSALRSRPDLPARSGTAGARRVQTRGSPPPGPESPP